MMPRLLVALITSMTAVAVNAQTSDARPRLVVGIVIDGLDGQYVDMLRSHFGEGGFNRLLRESVMLANADYGTNVDATAATAMLMTGAAPAATGITGAEIYDRDALRCAPALRDSEVRGTYTDQALSPRALTVGTLADEVRITGGGVTRVYAVAPDAQQSILLAGHSANCALWINPSNGNWASSSYYTEVPPSIASRNRLEPLNLRLDTVQWKPLLGPEA
ncbi:MAG: alkaline phosphatase family protein, partial [Muribaculaceae bacterium]|nr:alkaline phosphatase family protein [Muribaculaceae bacterium]